jgi:P pilus assembly chaperone PapD
MKQKPKELMQIQEIKHGGFRRAMLLTSLVAASLGASAQPQLTVTRELQNVGDVMFQQPKSISFEIKNSGNEALVLKAVNMPCGCLQASWPQEAIHPGKTAKIELLFDAALLGTFQKEVEIYSNASDEPTYLTVLGRVVREAVETNYDDFPIDLGNIRLSTNNVEFNDIYNGQQAEATLQVVNMSKQSYKPELMHLPPYLTARYLPEKLAGGRVGRIVLTLNSSKLKSYGLTETTIYLSRKLGDRVSPQNEINVSAVLLPSFAHLTAQEKAKAPQLQLSADSLDFGSLGTKRKAKQTILVTNTGQSRLTISSVQVQGRALNVSLSKRTIEPGKSAKLTVTVLTEQLRKAKTAPRILIIANDPKRPKVTLQVQGK